MFMPYSSVSIVYFKPVNDFFEIGYIQKHLL